MPPVHCCVLELQLMDLKLSDPMQPIHRLNLRYDDMEDQSNFRSRLRPQPLTRIPMALSYPTVLYLTAP